MLEDLNEENLLCILLVLLLIYYFRSSLFEGFTVSDDPKTLAQQLINFKGEIYRYKAETHQIFSRLKASYSANNRGHDTDYLNVMSAIEVDYMKFVKFDNKNANIDFSNKTKSIFYKYDHEHSMDDILAKYKTLHRGFYQIADKLDGPHKINLSTQDKLLLEIPIRSLDLTIYATPEPLY